MRWLYRCDRIEMYSQLTRDCCSFSGKSSSTESIPPWRSFVCAVIVFFQLSLINGFTSTSTAYQTTQSSRESYEASCCLSDHVTGSTVALRAR